MENVRTQYYNLPNTIGGFTVSTPDGWYTVILNQNLSHQKNVETYQHELEHIRKGDFDRKCSVGLIEIFAHEKV